VTDRKNVVIAGASGVVGARALHHLLASDNVTRVVAVGRRLLTLQHEKLVSRMVDLGSKAAITSAIPDANAVAICCLGTTLKRAGSQEAFRAVDYGAVVAFAEAARVKEAQRFVVVSSLGANPRAGNFYLRTKGESEEALARLGYPQLTVLRPSFIDDEGARDEDRPLERLALPIARCVFSIVGRTSRYAPVSADVIGKAIVRLAFDNATERVRIVESAALHALGERTAKIVCKR
jgi:Predicted nucleoside-diphosphate-sugar epimerases